MEIKKEYYSTTTLGTYGSESVLVKSENHKIKVTKEEYVTEKIYSPYEHRSLNHPNSFFGAFIHVVKSSLGTGLLAIPRAFKNAGLVVGTVGNIFVGILCTHTVYILVQASQKVSVKAKVPSLGFADTAAEVFTHGPRPFRKWAWFAKLFVEIALLLTYYLGIAVYMVFISVSLTKLCSYYYPETVSWDKYLFKLITMCMFMLLCQIREIKHMVPFSFIANVMLILTFGITGYYIFSGLDSKEGGDIKLATSLGGFTSFFSTVLYAMEGIGSIMPVENSMVKPNFLGFNGVLNCAMVVVVFVFTSMGFLGYYRFGDATEVTITKNLPNDEVLAQVAQASVAMSVFFSFMLQFFVPTDILWNRIKPHIPKERQNISQITLRIVMLLFVTAVAIIGGENLGSLIDLVGAICFSILGFFVPALLDVIVNWEGELGIFYWKLIKNILIMLIALFGLASGSYYAILNILNQNIV